MVYSHKLKEFVLKLRKEKSMSIVEIHKYLKVHPDFKGKRIPSITTIYRWISEEERNSKDSNKDTKPLYENQTDKKLIEMLREEAKKHGLNDIVSYLSSLNKAYESYQSLRQEHAELLRSYIELLMKYKDLMKKYKELKDYVLKLKEKRSLFEYIKEKYLYKILLDE